MIPRASLALIRSTDCIAQGAELPVATAHELFTADGQLREPQLAAALCSIVSELLDRSLRDAA